MWLYFVFAALIVVIDQLFKLWTAATIAPGTAIPLIPYIIRLTYTENTGAAFSILADKRWLLVGVSSVAAVAISVVIARKRPLSDFVSARYERIARFCTAAILGGAVGNLIDRIKTGAVIDMFEAEFINFAIFNIADIFITLGCLTLIVLVIKQEIDDRKAKKAGLANEAND